MKSYQFDQILDVMFFFCQISADMETSGATCFDDEYQEPCVPSTKPGAEKSFLSRDKNWMEFNI